MRTFLDFLILLHQIRNYAAPTRDIVIVKQTMIRLMSHQGAPSPLRALVRERRPPVGAGVARERSAQAAPRRALDDTSVGNHDVIVMQS